MTRPLFTRRATLAVSAALAAPWVARAQSGGSLSYWSMRSVGEPQQKVIAAALESFTAETGVKVTTQWIGRNNLQRLAPTLNTANVPADLVDGASRNVKSVLVATDNHLDLAPALKAELPGEPGKTVADVIPKAYLDGLVVKNQNWMVPYEIITSMFWYNGATNPGLTAAPPRTWADFVKFCAERKAAGRAPIALDGDISNFNLYYFAEIAVRMLGPGKLREAVADRTGDKLRDPKILHTARLIEGLVKEGYFARGYDSGKWPTQQQQWATNRIDLEYMGTWIASEASSYAAPGFEYRAFPMPAPAPDAIDSVEVSFIGFGIPRKARNAEAAARFIAYFMSKARLSAVADTAHIMTVRSDIGVPPELTDARRAIDKAPALHGQFDGVIDDYADYVNKVLNPLNNELVFGKRSAEDFHEQLVAQTARYWARN